MLIAFNLKVFIKPITSCRILSIKVVLFSTFIAVSKLLSALFNKAILFSLLSISFFKLNKASLNFFKLIFSCIKIPFLSFEFTFCIRFINITLYSWDIPKSSQEFLIKFNSSLYSSSNISLLLCALY